MANFQYFEHMNDNQCSITLQSDIESGGCYTYSGTPADFLCHVLNKNWWKITEETLNNQELNEIAKAYFALGRTQNYNTKSPIFNLIDKSFSTINFENLNLFAEEVLLENRSRKLTVSQRALAYNCIYSKDDKYFDFENIQFKDTQQEIVFENFNDELRMLGTIELTDKNPAEKKRELDNFIRDKNCTTCISCQFESFKDLVCYIILYLIKNNLVIKKCDCCKKYFYPQHRIDTLYCDNYAPDEDNLNRYIRDLENCTKPCELSHVVQPLTCPKYMTEKNRLEREKRDECSRIYRQIYNSLNNKFKRSGSKKIKNKIDKIREENSEWKLLVKQGKVSKDEYLKWIKKIKAQEVALPNGIQNWNLQNEKSETNSYIEKGESNGN